MKLFDNNVDSSLNALRAVFLTSSIVVNSRSRDKTKQSIINELANTIIELLKEYLVDLQNATIDEVCGRIEYKLQNFLQYNIEFSDECIDELKKHITKVLANKKDSKPELDALDEIDNLVTSGINLNNDKENNNDKNEQINNDTDSIILSINTIGLTNKLNTLRAFFNTDIEVEDDEENSKEAKNKKKKEKQSLLLWLNKILSFPFKILKLISSGVPKWLTSDLVSPKFLNIIEKAIFNKYDELFKNTLIIAKHAIKNKTVLKKLFKAEIDFNRKMIRYNRKLTAENRRLAVRIIKEAFKVVLKRALDVVKKIPKVIKETIGIFKDIILVIKEIFVFTFKMLSRVFMALLRTILIIIQLTIMFMPHIFMLFVYLLQIIINFLVAFIIIVFAYLLITTVISAIFLLGAILIAIIAIVFSVLMLIIATVICAILLIIAVIAIAIIAVITVVALIIIGILSIVVAALAIGMAVLIFMSGIFMADLLLIFTGSILMFIGLIVSIIGTIFSLTLSIFLFFVITTASIVASMFYSLLAACLLIFSVILLSITTFYTFSILMLAISLIILALAIFELGKAINLLALLVLIIFFGLLFVVAYLIGKFLRIIVDFLTKYFGDNRSTVETASLSIIGPLLDYIDSKFSEFLADELALKNLKNKLDEWLLLTPEQIHLKVVNAVKNLLNKAFELGYTFIETYVKNALDLVENILHDQVIKSVIDFVNGFLSHNLGNSIAVYIKNKDNAYNIGNSMKAIAQKKLREPMINAHNEMRERGIFKERSQWNIIGKLADAADVATRGVAIIYRHAKYDLSADEKSLYFTVSMLGTGGAFIFGAFTKCDLFIKAGGTIDVPKTITPAVELTQQDAAEVWQKLESVFKELDAKRKNENDKIVAEIKNNNEKCKETATALDNLVKNRVSTITMEDNQIASKNNKNIAAEC